MLYSFDTSAILNGRRDLFRPAVFRSLWGRVEDAISAGQIRSVDEVQRELARRDDDAKRWADGQTGLFCPLDEQIQQAARHILRLHPNLDRQEWRTEASLDVGRPENAPRNETLVRTKILRSSGSTREHVVRPVGMGAGKVLQPGDGRRRVQTWLLSAG